jgi:YHS domain-containing protein
MTPLRLVIIICLLYILYRLLISPRDKRVRGRRRDAPATGNTVQDVLVEDPVCHTFIPKGQAVRLHHEKQMYYFCSNKCCEMFLKKKGDEE